jgi:hypothetical protein
VTGSPYPGECWAIEAELTPKPLTRTAAIMAGMLARTTPARPRRSGRYSHGHNGTPTG